MKTAAHCIKHDNNIYVLRRGLKIPQTLCPTTRFLPYCQTQGLLSVTIKCNESGCRLLNNNKIRPWTSRVVPFICPVLFVLSDYTKTWSNTVTTAM